METATKTETEIEIVYTDNWGFACLLACWFDLINGLNVTAVVTVVTGNSLGIITVTGSEQISATITIKTQDKRRRTKNEERRAKGDGAHIIVAHCWSLIIFNNILALTWRTELPLCSSSSSPLPASSYSPSVSSMPWRIVNKAKFE